MAKILMIYLEPAPYTVAFIRETRAQFGGRIDVIYVSVSGSQDWNTSARQVNDIVFPNSLGKSFFALWKLLKNNHYDLVHLAGWGHPILFATLIYCGWRRIPTVVESDTQSKHSKGSSQGPWLQWRSRLNRAGIEILKATIYPPLFRMPAFFLPGGTRQKNYLMQYGVTEAAIKIGKMTVDVEGMVKYCDFHSQDDRSRVSMKLGLGRYKFKFLYVGRLEDYKGIGDLIDAFFLLADSCPDAALIVVGDGPMRSVVEEATSRLMSLHYCGRLEGLELWDIYVVSDVLIVPSRRDNWGLVVNEGMAFGLPVITTDNVGCVEDLVRPSATGLVVPTQDPAALAAAMRELVGDCSRCRKMGEDGRRLISDWTLAEQARIAITAWTEALT